MDLTMSSDYNQVYSIIDLDEAPGSSSRVVWKGSRDDVYRVMRNLKAGRPVEHVDFERRERTGKKPGRKSSTEGWVPPEGLKDELAATGLGSTKLCCQWLYLRGLSVKQISVFLGIRYQHAYQAVGGLDGLEAKATAIRKGDRPRCRRCGRPLTDPGHIVAGIGPMCLNAELEELEADLGGSETDL